MPPMFSCPKLFLIDGMALIFRAYYALQNTPRITSYQKNTSAQFGFINTLLELLEKNNPTHIAVAFDTPTPTERHLLYKEYKANREEPPEELISAIPDIKMILNAFRIPLLIAEGYEADDIIGTLSVQAKAMDFDTYMVTMDKDYGQLVNEKVFIYRPAHLKIPAQILTALDICQKWNIANPKQVIDMLAMMGDSVDNIPGIKGVGEKTAAKLLAEYGSLETILFNAINIKGVLGEKIRAGRENALLSKKLATINLNTPITIDWDACRVQEWNESLLSDIFVRLEFRTLHRRLIENINPPKHTIEAAIIVSPPSTTKENVIKDTHSVVATQQKKESPLPNDNLDAPPLATIQNITHNYTLHTDTSSVKNLLQTLYPQSIIAIDTETTGLDVYQDECIGISLCAEKGVAHYVALPEDPSDQRAIIEMLQRFLQKENTLWIGHHIKFDKAILARYGCHIKGRLFDTMVAAYLIDSAAGRSMDILARHYLSYDPIPLTQLIGTKKAQQIPLRSVPLTDLAEYAAEDADITFQLYQVLKEKLATLGLADLFHQIEMPLVDILLRMEQRGIPIDKDFMMAYSEELAKRAQQEEAKIYAYARKPFNVNSPKQLSTFLFEELALPPTSTKTKMGLYTTNEETLKKLQYHHIVIGHILDYRELTKLKSTYADALGVAAKNGRVHTEFSQTTVVTGRLASVRPNLQNIPIRTPLGRRLRQAFIAQDGWSIVCADYAQIELRVIAALSGDEHMIADFKASKDIHKATAARIFEVSEEKVTQDMRRRAKSVNFGIIYGQGAFGLSQQLGIPRKEAKNLIDSYFARYAGLAKYMEQQVQEARDKGGVRTLLGRVRWLANIHSRNANVRAFDERNAVNMPVQGTAADMIKKAMIAIDEQMTYQQYQAKMLLQVHDELVFEAPPEEVTSLTQLLLKYMPEALPLPNDVPVEISVGVGKNWLEAH